MRNKLKIGQWVGFIESDPYWIGYDFADVATAKVFDKIAKAENGNYETETGIKFKESNANFGSKDFVFRGNQNNRVKKLPYVLEGKESINKSYTFSITRPDGGFSIFIPSDDFDMDEYNKNILERYEFIVKREEDSENRIIAEQERKKEGLKELILLKEKNDIVRQKMNEEEFELEQKLIKERCPDVHEWVGGFVSCRRW